MLQDGDGTLWLGSWSHGLFRMDADGTLKQVINPTLTGAGLHIHSLLYNSPHTLFIGCDDGLLRYDIATNRWSRYPESAQSHDVSNDDRFVYTVIRDREGGQWYGTFYGGVKYVSPVSHRFVSFSAAEGQRGNVVGHFCEDGMGHVSRSTSMHCGRRAMPCGLEPIATASCVWTSAAATSRQWAVRASTP